MFETTRCHESALTFTIQSERYILSYNHVLFPGTLLVGCLFRSTVYSNSNWDKFVCRSIICLLFLCDFFPLKKSKFKKKNEWIQIIFISKQKALVNIMTVNKRSLEYKTIDPGFKTIVLPKILIKFDLKNITNTYIHKYKINFFEWPPVALGIKSLHAWPLLVYMASFPNFFLLRQSHWPAFCSSSTMLRFLIHRI